MLGGPHSVRRPRPVSEFLCEREAVQLHCGCEGGFAECYTLLTVNWTILTDRDARPLGATHPWF
jgi:hypothetical protein